MICTFSLWEASPWDWGCIVAQMPDGSWGDHKYTAGASVTQWSQVSHPVCTDIRQAFYPHFDLWRHPMHFMELSSFLRNQVDRECHRRHAAQQESCTALRNEGGIYWVFHRPGDFEREFLHVVPPVFCKQLCQPLEQNIQRAPQRPSSIYMHSLNAIIVNNGLTLHSICWGHAWLESFNSPLESNYPARSCFNIRDWLLLFLTLWNGNSAAQCLDLISAVLCSEAHGNVWSGHFNKPHQFCPSPQERCDYSLPFWVYKY